MAKTNSATPKVIMANGVPDLRVVTHPSKMAKPMPATPPTMGSKLTGMCNLPAVTAFNAWMAMYEPKPVYTAWPKLSMPPCPSNML